MKTRKYSFYINLLRGMVIIFAFAACSLDGTIESIRGKAEGKENNSLAVTITAIAGVTPPAFGETPAAAITETEQFTGTVAWSPAVSGSFAASTAYIATITLTPKAGYTFDGIAANFFTVAGAVTVSNAANSSVVTAAFPATQDTPPETISIKAIQGVTPPATEAAPVTAITANDQYTGTVAWSPTVSETFAAATQYTAIIALTAKPGYTLHGVAADFFTIAGATATNAANSGVVSAIFPATGTTPAVDVPISIAVISGVTPPDYQQTPVTAIAETAEYTGTVQWSPPVTGTFAASTSYTAIITLTPKTGYTLSGVSMNFFAVAGATASNGVNAGLVTAGFPPTGAVPPVPVTIAAISGVTAPATGAVPATTITETPQYTGIIEWSPAVTDVFAASEVYTASITLTPKTGYTFKGVAANFFAVIGASAANAVDSGLVTAVFPSTGFLTVSTDVIQGVVPPAYGETPVTAVTETDEYTGTVQWSPAVAKTFAATTEYIATITLTPKPGYTFTGVGANFFTVAGAITGNTTNSGSVTAVFPPTGNAPPQVITIRAIPGVTAPAYNGTPVTTITATSQYTGTVQWSPAVSGTFAGSTVYTATIILTPLQGYTFTGVTDDFFTVAGASATNAANSSTIIAAFPITIPAPRVNAPTVSPPGDSIIQSGNAVALNCTTTDAEIWYTTNGNTPAKNGSGSIKYTAPITLTDDVTIKAIAVKDSMTDSYVLTASYTVTGRVVPVTDSTDDEYMPGTLPHALVNARDGDIIWISEAINTITLESSLEASRTLTIEGNGVTITRVGTGTWAEDSSSQLMGVVNTTATVTMRRIHFKDGRATDYGAAIANYGNLNLESCIFSGNRTSGSSAYGGAICNRGTLSVMGCTFYDNGTVNRGGAIYMYEAGSVLTLAGNLFYWNTASNGGPVVYRQNGTVISLGYNVVDAAIGTGGTESGWAPATGDKTITGLPISTVNFKLLPSGGAAGVVTSLPSGYPAYDFYGDEISAPAAAGAVQSTGVPEPAAAPTAIPADGSTIQAGNTVTLTSTEGAEIWYTTNGNTPAQYGTGSTKYFEPIVINDDITIKAIAVKSGMADSTILTASYTVTGRTLQVTGSADTNTSGTLRYALANARAGDTVKVDGSVKIIILASSRLVVNKNITIEGNGVTITRGSTATWAENTNTQLMTVTDGTTAKISRVHFKDGRSTDDGAAIYSRGNLTLESCIFSGNRMSGSSQDGGAIHSWGTTNVLGCTFYDNHASNDGFGGAIYHYNGTLTLTGNLFYGNTTSYGPNRGHVVYRNNGSGTVISGGYNVSDKTMVTNAQDGYADDSTDITITSLFISPNFKLLSGNAVSGVVAALPAGYPAKDFYDNTITAPAAAGAVQSTESTPLIVTATPIASPAGGRLRSGDKVTLVCATGGAEVWYTTDGTSPSKNGSNSTRYTNPISVTAKSTIRAMASANSMTDSWTMTSEYTVAGRVVNVNSSSDASVSGTLRHALENANDEDIITINVPSITLTSRLEINKSLTIEGNGVTISPSVVWTEDSNSQLIHPVQFNNITISRVHFKDGRSTDYGAAISNNANLTLESCIFSGNRTGTGSYARGGAIYNGGNGNIDIIGCTFYDNHASSEPGGGGRGGAIYVEGSTSTVTLTGNLFYGNKAGPYNNYGQVIYRGNGYIISGGYNAYDGKSSDSNKFVVNYTDYIDVSTDKTISSLPISSESFKLLPGNEVGSPINPLPSGYPFKDFYGDTITAPAASGAVQSVETPKAGITISVIPVDGAPLLPGVILYLNPANGSVAENFSVANPELYSFIGWNVPGTGVSGNGPVFVFNTGYRAFNTAGEYELTVEVITKTGVPYNRTVTITVVE